MSYTTGFATAGKFHLHYLKMGSGPKLLVAFHGYGRDASIFLPVEKYLGNDYTIYSVDLPYHGKSECENMQMEKRDLVELVANLQKEMGVEKASLMGYSLGGRVCITLVELMPERLERVVLLASDGLTFNSFYYFLTNTIVGSRLFKNFLTRPQKYMRFIDWLKERKFIDAHKHGFAMWYLQNESTRTFLLKVWPCLRKLIPLPRKVRAAIAKHDLPVYVFMGAQDKVIPVKLAHSFKRNLESVHLYVLDKGHRVMDNDTLPQITNCLLD